MSWQQDDISQVRAELIARHGEWWDNFALAEGVWTLAPADTPNPRVIKILQMASDLANKPLSQCRVLDLACANGQFSLEFALRGACVLGIEGREANIEKARFAKAVFGLDNLTFVQEDVRAVSKARFGAFDIIVCSGILYHLPGDSQGAFIQHLYDMTTHMIIVDTHVALTPATSIPYRNTTYYGTYYREHWRQDGATTKAQRIRASLDNPISFWLTRPSLVNLLTHVDFSSIYECFHPPFPGAKDRCTFVAIKGTPVALQTFPPGRPQQPPWPDWREGELSYANESRLKTQLRWWLQNGLDRSGIAPSILTFLRRIGNREGHK